MRIEFGPFAYLLRALSWLESMSLALLQARRWLRGRFCLVWAAEHCWRDALAFGRIARGDLWMWRWMLAPISRPFTDAELADVIPAADEPVLSWREFGPFNAGGVL